MLFCISINLGYSCALELGEGIPRMVWMTATALFNAILFWKTDVAEFINICSETLNLVKIGQKHWALHMTQKHVLLLPVTLIAKEGLSSTEMVSGC